MTKDGAGANEPDPTGPAPDGSPTDGSPTDGAARETAGSGGVTRSAVRWFHRPVALGVTALVLAVSGASTIAYAVSRPDANHPPSVAGAESVSAGVPAPVLPAAPVASPIPTVTASAATRTLPPPLPTASVIPIYPSPTATPSASRSRSGTRTSSPSRSPSPTPSPSRSRSATPSPEPSPSRTAKPTPSRTAKPTPTPTTARRTLPAPLASSDPVEVVVRKLGIDRRPIRLGVTKDNALEVPDDAEDLGWYTGGPTPGAVGAAVVAGHVSYNKPGVFYRLATLERGDTIEVERKDGTTAVFTVSGTRVYPKDKFPTDDVYGFVDRAALRLITCGGDYDAKTRHFDDNIVVYADMTSVED